LRIQPHGIYNLTPSFIKNGEISKSLFSYKIKLFDQVINFGRINETIENEEKEWFGKKGGKKPRKGPAKKKKGKGGDQEEGIWIEEIWTWTAEEWECITSEELCKIKEG
jgi:hypothetical protein